MTDAKMITLANGVAAKVLSELKPDLDTITAQLAELRVVLEQLSKIPSSTSEAEPQKQAAVKKPTTAKKTTVAKTKSDSKQPNAMIRFKNRCCSEDGFMSGFVDDNGLRERFDSETGKLPDKVRNNATELVKKQSAFLWTMLSESQKKSVKESFKDSGETQLLDSSDLTTVVEE